LRVKHSAVYSQMNLNQAFFWLLICPTHVFPFFQPTVGATAFPETPDIHLFPLCAYTRIRSAASNLYLSAPAFIGAVPSNLTMIQDFIDFSSPKRSVWRLCDGILSLMSNQYVNDVASGWSIEVKSYPPYPAGVATFTTAGIGASKAVIVNTVTAPNFIEIRFGTSDCLTVPGHKKGVGTQILIMDCRGSLNQRFYMVSKTISECV